MLLAIILLSVAIVLLNIGVIVLLQRMAAMQREINILKSCVQATSGTQFPKLETPDEEK